MSFKFVLLVAAAALAAPAAAAPLVVRVTDGAGRPLPDAVVTLYPAAEARAPASGGSYVGAQQKLQFRPFVTVVPVGSDVSFPNLDPVRHHVYSFSAAKRFELKLFAKDQSRTVHFDKPGVVALGCNIHDQMKAFIVVTDSAWTAQTNAAGIASFDAPAGRIRATIFHPYLRAAGNRVEQVIAPGQRNLGVTLQVRPPMAMHSDY